MDLLALSDFNLVARHGGFGRAARTARRPKATLSRRVAELESSLGVRLFDRGTRTLRLTEEGRALHDRTAGLLGEIDEVAAAIASGTRDPRGVLRISAPTLFSQMAMGRIAAGFALLHPAVRLEITAEDRTVDMVEEGYDLIVRVNPRPDEELIGRCFLRDQLVVAAAPTLPRPEARGEVRAVLRLTADPPAFWHVRDGVDAFELEPVPIMQLSSLVMVRDAVRAGAGAGILPLSMVSADLARGSLVRWGTPQGSEVGIWALYTSRRLLSSKVSAFLDYLGRTFPKGTSEELAAFMAGA
ncbi:LysR family transcriptional regulator [Sphingosinicella sp. CPCC 101087]|uniref:LysR family transcriptional regulator n=1 Tax=Sphingosinicella sp. CPCC 101087 TaxID=2497754 RepID=UPI00101DA27D|nr:LysR family transcriptional regulator [Sphingosinicella sp. CPCC 101087]